MVRYLSPPLELVFDCKAVVDCLERGRQWSCRADNVTAGFWKDICGVGAFASTRRCPDRPRFSPLASLAASLLRPPRFGGLLLALSCLA